MSELATPGDSSMFSPIEQPVINKPYETTKYHWELDRTNRAMPIRKDGRRPSVATLPVPDEHDPELGEQRILELNPEDLNETVNEIRRHVSEWRKSGRYVGATDASKRLLKHWNREDQALRPFFAQVEALETMIWLTEVAPQITQGKMSVSEREQASIKDLLAKVQAASRNNNEGLDRLAIKMATGTGKTVVMGMVIAWHALNAFEAHKLPEDQRGRYLTSFVAITPGHTVRERLETLKPSPQERVKRVKSVYDEMGLLPSEEDRIALNRVQVHIVNFQVFQPKDRLAHAHGDAKKLLRGRSKDESDTEEPSAMLRRVLHGLRGLADTDPNAQICVLNDEAHHCYLPAEGRRDSKKASKEDKDQDKSAALWFSAIKSLDDSGWLGAVYDFSATPMFIQTSSRRDTQMFPWVVSDYPLMDAIEAGLVKIPRVPVYDDTQQVAKEPTKDEGDTDAEVLIDPTELGTKWRSLYKHVDEKRLDLQSMPPKLTSAVRTFYENYQIKFEAWKEKGLRTPPVFIVVANNINNAEALYHYLAGKQSGFDLFSNFATGAPDTALASSLNTLIVHSDLEGDKEIGSKSKLGVLLGNQAELLGKRVEELREEGKEVENYEGLSAKELVREALNTVGRDGELGANIRCVVSVSMLTEGWDTRTVTHVLGYRAFGTQLLCEQVTGRALRRTNYENFDDEGRLEPQFADVLGIPFDFMPVGDSSSIDSEPGDTYEVRSVSGRDSLRIEFPRITSYLVEPSGIGIVFNPDRVEPYQLGSVGPSETVVSAVVGESQTLTTSPDQDARHQQIIVKVASVLVEQIVGTLASEGVSGEQGHAPLPRRRQLFSQAVHAVRYWLSHPKVNVPPDQLGRLLNDEIAHQVADKVRKACEHDLSESTPAKRIGVFAERKILGSTEDVLFETSARIHYPADLSELTKKSELNIAPCDSKWEEHLAGLLDDHPKVQAWARNTPQLDWSLPYQFEGRWRNYIPDFVVRLGDKHSGGHGEHAVHLLIEVKGKRDESDDAKAEHALRWWIPAVRNSPQVPAHLRDWEFVEFTKEAGEDDSQFGWMLNNTIKQALATGQK